MAKSPDLTTPTDTDAIVEDYLRRVDAGEQIDQEAFLAQHPDVAPALQSFFANEQLLRKGASDSRLPAGDTTPKDAVLTMAPSLDPAQLSGPKGAVSLPAMMGRYRIEKELGRGAMGAVYRAHDTDLDRPVALKFPHFASNDQPELITRFLREARSAAVLAHPNICRVYDVSEFQGTRYIAMEFIDGKPLSAFIGNNSIQPKQAASVIRKLALGLAEAHKQGIIHRDLKPDNILINSKGEPVLTDFGLARATSQGSSSATQDGVILGSPAYMPPEQAAGNLSDMGPTSDVYSLGVVLYQMLTGDVPFRGSVVEVLASVLMKAPKTVREAKPDIDPGLAAICDKMMSKKPADRYPSMTDVAVAVNDWLKNAANPPSTATIAPTKSSSDALAGDLKFADPVAKPKLGSTHSIAPKQPQAGTPKPQQTIAPGTKTAAVHSPQQLQELAELVDQLLVRNDYLEAIRIVEELPDYQRTPELRRLLGEGYQVKSTVEKLERNLEKHLNLVDIPALKKCVDQLLKLRPSHPRGKEIRKALNTEGKRGVLRIRKESGQFDAVGSVWEPWKLAAGVAAILVMGVIAYFGVTIFLKNNMQTVQIEIDDPTAVVKIDGDTVNISGAGTGEVQLKLGSHNYTVSRGDSEVITDGSYTVKLDGQNVLRITTKLTPPPKPGDGVAGTKVDPPKSDGPSPGKLPTEQWVDLFPFVKLPDDVVAGAWQRDGDRIACTEPSFAARVMLPVTLRGNYEVKCEIIRDAGDENLGITFPVGDYSTSTFLSGWGGQAHGIHYIDGKQASELDPGDKAVHRPGTLVNGQRYQWRLVVENSGAEAKITSYLDDKEILSWSGNPNRLSVMGAMAVPLTHSLSIVAHGVTAEFQKFQVKIAAGGEGYLLGDDWQNPITDASPGPPAEIRDKCLDWNGRKYFISDKPMPFADAQQLACNLKGQLLSISSKAEEDFLVANGSGRELWTSIWYRGDYQAFRDRRNRPLSYQGAWRAGAPTRADAERFIVVTTKPDCQWWTASPVADNVFACIEWSEETTQTASTGTAPPLAIAPFDAADWKPGFLCQIYEGTELGKLLWKGMHTVIGKGPNFQRIDGGIEPGVPGDNFSIRWLGAVEVVQPDLYTIRLEHDDGARLWIDDNLVIDKWQGGIHHDEHDIQLSAGWHTFRLEFYEAGATCGVHLLWRRPGREQEYIEGDIVRHDANWAKRTDFTKLGTPEGDTPTSPVIVDNENDASVRRATEDIPPGDMRNWSFNKLGANYIPDAQDSGFPLTLAKSKLKLASLIQGNTAQLKDQASFEVKVLGDFAAKQPFSLAIWAKPQSSHHGALIAKFSDAPSAPGYALEYNQGQFAIVLISDWDAAGGPFAIESYTKEKFTENEWHYALMTYDGSKKAAGVKLYIDGKLRPLAHRIDRLKGEIRNTQPLRIGARNVAQFFDGSLAEPHVYAKALTPAEAKREFEQTPKPDVNAELIPANNPNAATSSLEDFRGPFEILEAKYGSGDKSVDLTQRMQAAAKDGLLVAFVEQELSGQKFGGELSLKWKAGEQVRDDKVPHRRFVFLDARPQPNVPAQGLTILDAWFGTGILGEGQMVDIKEQLSQLIANDQLDVPAKQLTQGLPDPASGKSKVVIVRYALNGQIKTALFEEQEMVKLGNAGTD